MYLMYDSDGNFMGVLNESLEYNTLKGSPAYFFVKIPTLSIITQRHMNGNYLRKI